MAPPSHPHYVCRCGVVGFKHFGCDLWAQLGLRTATAALIDQDQIAASRIGTRA
jgi:hypothetical protein